VIIVKGDMNIDENNMVKIVLTKEHTENVI